MRSHENMIRSQENAIDQIPSCNCGALTIIFIVGLGSIAVLLSDHYATTINDGNKVFDHYEFHRLITSMWSTFSFTDLGIMIGCFIWLPFLTSEYQKKYSTVYLIYHFFRTHIIIQLLVDGIFQLLFILTTMKNFIQISAGILPYCHYMYMQKALSKPCEPVNYCFCPFPMSRGFVAFLIGLFLMFWTPESQGCLVVNVIFLVRMLLQCVANKCKCNQYMSWKQGPYCWFPFRIIEACIPGFIKRWDHFYSVSQAAQVSQQSNYPDQIANQNIR